MSDISLVMVCVECGVVRYVPFPALTSRDTLVHHLAADRWILSVVSPPGETEIALAAVCGECAKKVHHPAVLAHANAALERNRS